MKLINYSLVFIISIFNSVSYAVMPGSLQSQCDADNGTMIYNKVIQKFNMSVMWRPGKSPMNAVNIKINDSWYGAIAEDTKYGDSSKGLSNFAQAAYLINLTVNVCVKDKYLRGVEGVN
ncbi:putative AB5 enterotoxin binding subunit YtxB [Yersinia rochesterensis]|uniref:putative AB5 enterotoxin binding subunit YtxB n=1 Tax=Yersinia rochesterensis TaxID=1604335 RepID=UPI00119EB36A|nr:putative AB5 enterotoxin binding subunit YtxB [Yersinia rochesterensis]